MSLKSWWNKFNTDDSSHNTPHKFVNQFTKNSTNNTHSMSGIKTNKEETIEKLENTTISYYDKSNFRNIVSMVTR